MSVPCVASLLGICIGIEVLDGDAELKSLEIKVRKNKTNSNNF
jgi:hypothetical protein